eukprot:maker-scaffold_9-snap-gene-0.2-mRNA-1 protein AED:0.00 eAED:0.00 QI:52/1/1/1/1/1/2/93/86
MASATPLLYGTAFFVCFWALGIIIGVILRAQRKLSNGDTSLYKTFVTVGVFCMWMMWSMVWLSQLNPVLLPEGEAHESSEDHHLIL